ncbi:MAG: Type II secretion system protein E [bacterium ADurb.Bin212]|nr:MAG: Type II secretion system protein E [bacterium ADurb.Bin212]
MVVATGSLLLQKMPNQIFQNNVFPAGQTAHDISVQSVLDVFVIQGLISQSDAESLKNRYKTNRDLENILISNKVATRESINKAYSIILKIPYVSLLDTKIDTEVLNIIPKQVAQKYSVVAFGLNGNILQLAVAKPLELNAAFRTGIESLMANKPYVISLFITSPSDFNEAIKQYSGRGIDSKLKSSSYPVVFLRNQNIPKNLIQKLPQSFIEKHRAIIFDQRGENLFLMAAERPDDSEVRRAVDYIQKQNKVIIQLMATSKDDIDYIVKHYSDPQEIADEVLEKNDDISGENPTVEEAKPTDSPKTEETKPDTTSSQEKITFSGLFSGLKNKKNSGPVLTVDSTEPQDDQPDSDASPLVGGDLSTATEDQIEQTPKADDTKEELPSETLEEDRAEDSGTANIIQDLENLEIKKEDIVDTEPVTIEGDNTAEVEQPKTQRQSFDGEMEIGSLLDNDIKSDADLKTILAEKYIPKVVAAIINYALFLRSSDVHIEAGAKDLRIRYRVDGILRDIAKLPLEMHPPVISRIKILAKMKIDETRIPQDGRFDVMFKHKQVDVRVSALPTVHGEKMVLRVLDKDQSVLSLEDLGMVGRAFEITVENIAKPYGIILSTGPTGSGKSTTLYAILNRISTPSVNIITLEDPVEYEIQGVNQCQIKPAIGFTFAEGLRSVLRQDPNVVMVGEVRDAETAAMATHAALTGHLVLSTLHTNDASGALPRLTNMGIEPFLITSSINEIIAQRLVRRICPKCKEEVKIPQSLIDAIKRELDTIPKNNKLDLSRIKPEFKFFHGVGCSECNNGYKGRVGIFEVLRMTEKVEALAIDRRSANDIQAASIEDGMITMRHDGLLKCLEGVTTVDEVYRATSG